jgi:hypothetical protein
VQELTQSSEMVQTPLHYEGGEKEIKKIQKENSGRFRLEYKTLWS